MDKLGTEESAYISFSADLSPDGTLHIRGSGTMTVQDGSLPFLSVERLLKGSSCHAVCLDMSDVRQMDSSGIALIAFVCRFCRARGILFDLEAKGIKMQGLLDMLDMESLAQVPEVSARRKSSGLVASIGGFAISNFQSVRFVFVFIGEMVLSLYNALRHPRTLRAADVLAAIQLNGVNALPIVTLVNLLVGIVLAFQAAIQLEQFGANIYVANLVGLAQTREFGPMITAIILAGRSGSAFAAEIGSMKVNEEIDALITMGINPVRFLVVPKTLALLVSLPILALYADIMGLLGGLFVGITGLDLTVQGYLLQTRKALDLFDVFSGILKTFAFALLISGIGCLRGFQVRGGADSVGQAATSAVVTGIFFIILVDSIFTVIFQYV